MSSLCNRSQQTRRSERGFGLVELMVSISIMTLVSVVILARHNSFNGSVVLRNQAYEVAFALREAQNYAVSAAFTGGANESSYRQRYGVHFDTSSSVYYLFRDADGDGSYDSDEAIGPPGRLDPRFQFSDFTTGGGASLSGSDLDVVFERPNFDALFSPSSSDGTVRIVLTAINPNDNGVNVSREIEITGTGQIAVLSN